MEIFCCVVSGVNTRTVLVDSVYSDGVVTLAIKRRTKVRDKGQIQPDC